MVDSRHPEQWRRPALREPGLGARGQFGKQHPLAFILELDTWWQGKRRSELSLGSCICQIVRHSRQLGSVPGTRVELFRSQETASGNWCGATAPHPGPKDCSGSQTGGGADRYARQAIPSQEESRRSGTDVIGSAPKKTLGCKEGLKHGFRALPDGWHGSLRLAREQWSGRLHQGVGAPESLLSPTGPALAR